MAKRTYPIAEQVAGVSTSSDDDVGAEDIQQNTVRSAPHADDKPYDTEAMEHRAPPGAPLVRPSVEPLRGPEAISQAALEQVADSAFLVAQPDGTSQFDIAVRDDVFSNLGCSIAMVEGGIEATFTVSDTNTRRLLEGESDTLRVMLESKGLKVKAVRVVEEPPADR